MFTLILLVTSFSLTALPAENELRPDPALGSIVPFSNMHPAFSTLIAIWDSLPNEYVPKMFDGDTLSVWYESPDSIQLIVQIFVESGTIVFFCGLSLRDDLSLDRSALDNYVYLKKRGSDHLCIDKISLCCRVRLAHTGSNVNSITLAGALNTCTGEMLGAMHFCQLE